MRKNVKILVTLVLFLLPIIAYSQTLVSLDQAIESGARYLSGRFPRGTRAVIVAVQGENQEIGEIVYRRLSVNLVNGGWFTVVERNAAALETINREMERHASGMISQETERLIGQQLGAEVIISCSFNRSSQNWRLDIQALRVETAERSAQWSADVRSDPAWTSLASPRTISIVFDGDNLAQRERTAITNGMRSILQERRVALELSDNPSSSYNFAITVYMNNPPANPSLIQAEVIISFLQSSRTLFQSEPFNITETTETLIARRIVEWLRSDQTFFNKVNDTIR